MAEKKSKTKTKKSSKKTKKRKASTQKKSKAKDKLAVLKLGGSQYLVKEGTKLTVNRLPLEEGKKGKVEDVVILKPEIKKGTVTYKVEEHTKGPKITVSKFRAKSRYRRKMGFRASLSKIVVEKIGG